MSNTYRARSEAAEAAFDKGVFERDFSPSEEADWLASGLIELVPRKYKVLSNRFADGNQGDEVEAAYVVDVEAMLLSAGHLERVESKKPAKKTTPKKSSDD